MILFENLHKSFSVRGEQKVVIDHVNLQIPSGQSLALLGRNGAGKSTLLSIIAGTMRPTSGSVQTDGTVSWPISFAGSFHGDLTGAQNVRFIARIYGVDTQSLSEFVQEFSELGSHYHMPVRTYSSGMRSRLAFGASMGVPFDMYLVDEVTAVGDARFRRKSRDVFINRVENADAIMVSHDMDLLRTFCSSGVVLEKGRARFFESLEDAIDLHLELMKQ